MHRRLAIPDQTLVLTLSLVPFLAALPGCEDVSGLEHLEAVGWCVTPCDDAGEDAATRTPSTDSTTDQPRSPRADAGQDAGVHREREPEVDGAPAPDADASGSDAPVADVDDDSRGDSDAAATDAAKADAETDARGTDAEGNTDTGSTTCGSMDTVENCGACGVSCDTETNTEATCDQATCSYVCKAGRLNCDTTKPDTAGCECTTPACCGSSCETTHSDGVGQTFYDCEPPGTFTEQEATAACTASTGSSALCGVVQCGGGASSICTTVAISCVCWSYGSTQPGHVASGTLAPLGCDCPTASSPTWN